MLFIYNVCRHGCEVKSREMPREGRGVQLPPVQRVEQNGSMVAVIVQLAVVVEMVVLYQQWKEDRLEKKVDHDM